MEWIQTNLRTLGIGAALVIGVGLLSYIRGCQSGDDSGFARGYKKGQEDTVCEGGTHYRPSPQK